MHLYINALQVLPYAQLLLFFMIHAFMAIPMFLYRCPQILANSDPVTSGLKIQLLPGCAQISTKDLLCNVHATFGSCAKK
jgi:hypothetical protein